MCKRWKLRSLGALPAAPASPQHTANPRAGGRLSTCVLPTLAGYLCQIMGTYGPQRTGDSGLHGDALGILVLGITGVGLRSWPRDAPCRQRLGMGQSEVHKNLLALGATK